MQSLKRLLHKNDNEMKNTSILKLQMIIYGLFLIILSACGQESLATPTFTMTPFVSPSSTPSPIPTITNTPIPTYTNTPAQTPTATLKVFPQCSAEEYKSCYIAPKDMGAYAEWTKQQLLEQELSLPQPDPIKVMVQPVGGGAFWYTAVGRGNINKADRPYLPGYAFGYTEADTVWEGGKRRDLYVVTTIAFSVPGNPEELSVISVLIFHYTNISESGFIDELIKWSNNRKMRLAFVGDLVTMSPFRIEPISTHNESAFPYFSSYIDNFVSTLDPTSIDGMVFLAFP